MDLRVDDTALRELVAKSIVENLTPEAREKLISDAVKGVLTAQATGSYGRVEKSPLQQAFDRAVVNEAERYAHQILKDDENFKSQVQALFADVAATLFADDSREKLVSAMAETIRKALTKDRY